MRTSDVAMYLRISSDRTGDEQGVTRQREDGRALAKRRKWPVPVEYADNDVSASGRKRRPEFERLLADIGAGRVRVVIAWSLDRLTRNARDRLRLLELGREHGLNIALVRGSDLDLSTPAGRLTAEILGAVAAHEIEQKSDRQKRAVIQAAEQGRRVGGRRPFGYEADGVTLRPAEAEALREAYVAVLSSAQLAPLARQLNRAELFTPQGNPWTSQTLGTTLRNPRYAGIRAVGTGDAGRYRTWEHIGPAVWPAVVDRTTWDGVQAVLSLPERRTGAREGTRLLTGQALCGVCGLTVHAGGTAPEAKRRGYWTYRCRAGRGAHLSRRGDVVDEFVTAVLLGWVARERAQPRQDTGDELALLATQRAARQATLDGLAALYAEGVLTAAGVRAESARLKAALAELDERQAAASVGSAMAAWPAEPDALRAWFDGLAGDSQRDAVRLILEAGDLEVVLHPIGRGTRTFRPESVEVRPKNAQ